MKIHVKFFVFDLPPGFGDAEFTMGDKATVSDVLDACLELFAQRGVTMDENELRTATVMVGDKWSEPGRPVANGDIVTIIRPMDGG